MAATLATNREQGSRGPANLRDTLFSMEGVRRSEAQRLAETAHQEARRTAAQQAIDSARHQRNQNARDLRYGIKIAREIIAKLPEQLKEAVRQGYDRVEIVPAIEIGNERQMRSFSRVINQFLAREKLFGCLVHNRQKILRNELDDAETRRLDGPCYQLVHAGKDVWASLVIGIRPTIQTAQKYTLIDGWRDWEDRINYNYESARESRPKFELIKWPSGFGVYDSDEASLKRFSPFQMRPK